jgi:hypothetical protein
MKKIVVFLMAALTMVSCKNEEKQVEAIPEIEMSPM